MKQCKDNGGGGKDASDERKHFTRLAAAHGVFFVLFLSRIRVDGLYGRNILSRFRVHFAAKVFNRKIEVDFGVLAELFKVSEHFICRMIAFFHVRRHCLHADELQRLRHLRVDLTRRKRYGTQVLDRDGNGAVALKGQPVGQKLIEDDAGAVNVRARIDAVALCLLRRNIVDGAQRFLRERLRRVGKTGDAEVSHLNASVPQYHNVLRLNVTVDDAAGMRVAEPLHDLSNKMERFTPVELTALFHVLLERDPVDELHDDVFRFAAGHVVDRDNIRMGQHSNCLRFVTETAAEIGIFRKVAFEHLDGNKTIQPVALCLVHDRHAAAADHFEQLIAIVQHFTNHFIHTDPPSLPVFQQNGSDVVGRAVLPGERNEALQPLVQVICAANGAADLLICRRHDQTVRAEQQQIAVFQGHFIGVAGHAALGSERAGDQVAVRMCARLLRGNIAAFHQMLHDGMVVRNAADLPGADEVGAAVADVADHGAALIDDGGHKRCSHALTVRILQGAPMHGGICLCNAEGRKLAQLLRRHILLQHGPELLHIGIHGKRTCGFSAALTAHTVTNDGKEVRRSFRDREGILIFLAMQADIRQAGSPHAVTPPCFSDSLRLS